jgi:hypothetical protein
VRFAARSAIDDAGGAGQARGPAVAALPPPRALCSIVAALAQFAVPIGEAMLDPSRGVAIALPHLFEDVALEAATHGSVIGITEAGDGAQHLRHRLLSIGRAVGHSADFDREREQNLPSASLINPISLRSRSATPQLPGADWRGMLAVDAPTNEIGQTSHSTDGAVSSLSRQ